MLEIKNLNKRYGTFKAVDDLNLSIGEGEVFGFVGHNGAGKTTTMKIVAGLLDATSGSVSIAGIDAFANRNQVKRRIGYMPDFFGTYDNLKTIEYMEFYASLYGIVGKSAKSTCYDLLELVNLEDKAGAYVDHLSRGMKQRLCLARSLVHNPELLLLDEPASGLDPRARFEMKEIVKNLGSMGKTIVISSHILPELADMCDTVGIMQKGKLLMYGTVEDIQMRAMNTIPLHVKVLGDQETAVRILKENPYVKRVSVREDDILADFNGDSVESARLLKQLVAQDVAVAAFYEEKGNLESLFLEITENPDEAGNLAGNAAGNRANEGNGIFDEGMSEGGNGRNIDAALFSKKEGTKEGGDEV